MWRCAGLLEAVDSVQPVRFNAAETARSYAAGQFSPVASGNCNASSSARSASSDASAHATSFGLAAVDSAEEKGNSVMVSAPGYRCCNPNSYSTCWVEHQRPNMPPSRKTPRFLTRRQNCDTKPVVLKWMIYANFLPTHDFQYALRKFHPLDWVLRFNEAGPDGLRGQPRGDSSCRLSAEQHKELVAVPGTGGPTLNETGSAVGGFET